MERTLHFRGLNGIRAIAALAVLFSHATLSLSSFGLDSSLFGRYPDGNPRTTLLAGFGVSIFFLPERIPDHLPAAGRKQGVGY
ncbi:MAG: hypothetical protein WDN75_03410 [Bacteroidota bacterium]